MSRLLTNFWGVVLEAWTELRIHRTRVLLSLVGVAVAVTSLTTVVALGQIVQQATAEQNERAGGRPAILMVNGYTADGSPADIDALDESFAASVERYAIGFSSHNSYLNVRVQVPGAGVLDISGQAVDADYGTMHRVRLLDGEWFVPSDEERLAPAVIVNEYFWEQLGSPALDTHPSIVLLGENDVTAVIVGVSPSAEWEEYPSLMMLYSAYSRVTTPEVQALQPPSYEFWIPPAKAEQFNELLRRDISAALGSNYFIDVQRTDYGAYLGEGEDPYITLKLMIGGGSVLVLLLGALGLVNISLVTVRQRIREIGIRRSFGATAGRVFFAVMMESIVATFVAGAVGVLIAVLLVQSPLVQEQIGRGVVDLPSFPLEAAMLGIVASVAVGTIAGLLPALVAVRVKVIDAIRY